jgi:hypothetical protein
VPDSLTGVLSADEDEADVRVCEHVHDQPLDAEVLGLERAHDGDLGAGVPIHGLGEPVVGERADRERRMVSTDDVAAG